MSNNNTPHYIAVCVANFAVHTYDILCNVYIISKESKYR